MSLRDALSGLKQAQAEPEESEIEAVTKPIPRKVQLAAAARVVAQGRQMKAQASKAATGTAKSTNPDYVQLKVYVHGDRRRKAAHKWENEGGRDMSDLIEKLLDQYLGS